MARSSRAIVVLALVACKGGRNTAPAVGSAPPAPPPAVVHSAPPVDAAPGLVFADLDDDLLAAATVAFDGKPPQLPAVAADGSALASYVDLVLGMPTIPEPIGVSITDSSGRPVETLSLLDPDDLGPDAGSQWATPAVTAKLHDRAAAIAARLRGYRSLVHVELADGAKPTTIGDVALTIAKGSNDTFAIALRDRHGDVVHQEQLKPYEQGTRTLGLPEPAPCPYRPWPGEVYRDPAQPVIYLKVGTAYPEGCDPVPVRYLDWRLDTASEPDRELIARQFDAVGMNQLDRDRAFAKDAAAVASGMVTTLANLKMVGVAMHAMDDSTSEASKLAVTMSRDGNSAWASELASVGPLARNTGGRDVPWRASDVLARTPDGWRIVAFAWTEPVGNADAERRAKAGQLVAGKLDGDPGDAGLRAAFEKLTVDGVDAAAAARADLVAIGSGPGERTVGGAAFARPWNALWKGKVVIVSSIAHALPSGTTGWVAATIALRQAGYQLPLTVFCVFDKTADSQWSLVHIHFAS